MYIYIYVYMYMYIYICIYICNPAHRVSRPRGTGSVGDSVGEGAMCMDACEADGDLHGEHAEPFRVHLCPKRHIRDTMT